jgi:hypothetical protein
MKEKLMINDLTVLKIFALTENKKRNIYSLSNLVESFIQQRRLLFEGDCTKTEDIYELLFDHDIYLHEDLLNISENQGLDPDDPLNDIPAEPAPTPDKPSGPISTEEAKQMIYNTKGKIFTVTFIKKDGTTRVMNARLGVKKYLKGGELPYDPKAFGYIPVFDLQKMSYRIVNTNTIQKLKIGQNTYNVRGSLSENVKPEQIGKGLQLKFKDDINTYYAKNVANDYKHVYVVKGSDKSRTFKKPLKNIVKINGRPV